MFIGFQDKKSPSQVGSFTDPRDGKTYKTVKIGSQTWMAENLNYEAEGSKCYNNDPANGQKYGRLYDWYMAMKVCPSGWHLPSNADWDKLMRYVDGTNGTSSPYSGTTACRYLKATSGWNSNGNGQDTYGFSALPGGYGKPDGSFDYVGQCSLWWSSFESSSNYAYLRGLHYLSESADCINDDKRRLFSVRCVQD